MTERVAADAAAMEQLGARLAATISAPAVVGLEGPLGAGKTTLVRGFLRGLGHGGPVRSPTYNLLQTYAIGATTVHHLDLYRLVDPEELENLGVRDLLDDDAIWLVEWPGRGQGFLPPLDWSLRITVTDTETRRVDGLPAALEGM